MLAVSLILLLIFMSGRFIKYLAQAASGGISSDVIFLIMFYRLPGFLELILPLAFFMSILLVYGRMYLDSEMVVLHAGGFARLKLAEFTLLNSVLVAGIVALMSLYLSPKGFQEVDRILNAESQKTEFEMLTPGRFQRLAGSDRVTYIENLSEDKKSMQNVFIADMQTDIPDRLTAQRGTQVVDERTGDRFLVLDEGYRYRGQAGDPGYEVIEFEQYGLRLDFDNETSNSRRKDNAIPTFELLASDSAEKVALYHWRLSLPVLVPIIALIALSLSQVNPRQGRFAQLIPAMLLYIAYLGLLILMRKESGSGDISVSLGIWSVHLFFGLLALLLFNRKKLVNLWSARHASH